MYTRESKRIYSTTTMFGLLVVFLKIVGLGMLGGNSTESPLRERLHSPILGVAPTTIAEALTITTSTGDHISKSCLVSTYTV